MVKTSEQVAGQTFLRRYSITEQLSSMPCVERFLNSHEQYELCDLREVDRKSILLSASVFNVD